MESENNEIEIALAIKMFNLYKIKLASVIASAMAKAYERGFKDGQKAGQTDYTEPSGGSVDGGACEEYCGR